MVSNISCVDKVDLGSTAHRCYHEQQHHHAQAQSYGDLHDLLVSYCLEINLMQGDSVLSDLVMSDLVMTDSVMSD